MDEQIGNLYPDLDKMSEQPIEKPISIFQSIKSLMSIESYKTSGGLLKRLSGQQIQAEKSSLKQSNQSIEGKTKIVRNIIISSDRKYQDPNIPTDIKFSGNCNSILQPQQPLLEGGNRQSMYSNYQKPIQSSKAHICNRFYQNEKQKCIRQQCDCFLKINQECSEQQCDPECFVLKMKNLSANGWSTCIQEENLKENQSSDIHRNGNPKRRPKIFEAKKFRTQRCQCRKTSCANKNCVCFTAGNKCGIQCQCEYEMCHNKNSQLQSICRDSKAEKPQKPYLGSGISDESFLGSMGFQPPNF